MPSHVISYDDVVVSCVLWCSLCLDSLKFFPCDQTVHMQIQLLPNLFLFSFIPVITRESSWILLEVLLDYFTYVGWWSVCATRAFSFAWQPRYQTVVVQSCAMNGHSFLFFACPYLWCFRSIHSSSFFVLLLMQITSCSVSFGLFSTLFVGILFNLFPPSSLLSAFLRCILLGFPTISGIYLWMYTGQRTVFQQQTMGKRFRGGVFCIQSNDSYLITKFLLD